MNTDHRILTHAGRVLLSPAWPAGHAQLLMTSTGVMSSAALIAGLILSAPPPPARAAIAFTDLGNPGMLPVEQGHVARGGYDGDLDLALAGAMDCFFSELVTRVYRNDGGAFTDIGAGLPGLNVIRTGVNAPQVLNTQVKTR